MRRFEAAGFRAWPAASVHYDGTWAIRLTAGHPAKRLNSVNAARSLATSRIEAARIARAARRFEAYGRPLTFRMIAACRAQRCGHLDAEGWSHFGELLVMQLDLESTALDDAMDQIPLKDIGRFVDGGARGCEGPTRAMPARPRRDHRRRSKPTPACSCSKSGDMAAGGGDLRA